MPSLPLRDRQHFLKTQQITIERLAKLGIIWDGKLNWKSGSNHRTGISCTQNNHLPLLTKLLTNN
jgi:hypothetical protein